ncbi:LPXTG cell wall anchor domain-containing protein [Streptomyces sp. NPDC029004]|uniref:LPXTG cell wall anchor domain-containing protein n=1 Tax=Streptomyces sp. NPDC029004 TaxID=3154490 RepID=UPI0033F159D9
MSYLTRIRTRLGVRAAMIAVSAGLLVGGLPLLDAQEAAAAPRNRCDQKYGTPNTAPPATSLPGSNNRDATPNAEQYVYDYDNPSLGYDGLQLPASERELAAYGKDPKKWPNDRHKQIYARWNRNQANTDASKRWPKADFGGWLEATIRLEGNGKRGAGFERQVTTHYKLGGPEWLCQGSLKALDKKLYNELKAELGDKFPNKDRRFDAINRQTKTIYEFKAGGRFDYKEIHVDKALARRGWKVVYIFGEEPDDLTKRKLAEVDADGKGKIGRYKHAATPSPRYNNNTGYNKPAGQMNPGCQTTGTVALAARAGGICSSNGAADRMVNGSPKNQDQARRIAQAERGGADGSQRMRGPGGVDFSTLELRYVGTPVKGKGLDYSYKAGINPDPDENPSFGGKEKAQLVSDSFFTWMALTPEKFWVNLNPDQPDKIMDAKFGKTDAGRVLLEADLRMKHDFYGAMDPKTDLGKRFWDSLARRNGAPCLHGMRNWIEPEPAQVREQDGGIYILDAPMKLNSVPQETNTPGPGGKGCDLTKAEIDHNQRMVETMIVPEVKKQINSAPQYADLRRVYTSRVAAEWIRQQDAKKPTDFHKIINSNDVTRWPLRGENKNWDRNDVFQKYVKIFKEGEFKYNLEYGGEVYVYSVGGVDFSKAPKKNITKVRFDVENPRLPQITDRSKIAPRDYRDTGTQFLGGNTDVKPSGDPKPDPTPTPTGTGKPDPSSTPTDPSSQAPSTPAPTGGSNTTPPKDDDDGGLADTGAQVGLIAGIAAALLAAGGGLVWWKRRRQTAQH